MGGAQVSLGLTCVARSHICPGGTQLVGSYFLSIVCFCFVGHKAPGVAQFWNKQWEGFSDRKFFFHLAFGWPPSLLRKSNLSASPRFVVTHVAHPLNYQLIKVWWRLESVWMRRNFKASVTRQLFTSLTRRLSEFMRLVKKAWIDKATKRNKTREFLKINPSQKKFP